MKIHVIHFNSNLAALENASVDTKVLPRVTIIAIVLIVILVALVFLLAVGCCLCRSSRRRRRKHTKACERNSRARQQSLSAAEMSLSRNGSRRDKDVGGDFNIDNLAAAAPYPSIFNGKYRHEADVYFKSPFEGQQTDSSSADSKVDYRALARSLSMPNNEDNALNLPCNGDIPGRGNNGRLMVGSSYNSNNKGGSSCSLHLLQQQQRNRHGSVGANTTLDDDVFEDSSVDTTDGGFRSRHHSASVMPSSAKRLIGSSTSSGRNNSTVFQRFANDVGE